ncbi:hypothetical protein LR48_Vigan10g144600 [Vigna angularis]|uniref:Uncharacterized protein n=1 Tax=Phaseolus angularis TaxID=3914 RepID=A0A0L9VLF1_PHAAN|nr:hypothetical protein LR48_Vigan10g144600 [Vigna angularis]
MASPLPSAYAAIWNFSGFAVCRFEMMIGKMNGGTVMMAGGGAVAKMFVVRDWRTREERRDEDRDFGWLVLVVLMDGVPADGEDERCVAAARMEEKASRFDEGGELASGLAMAAASRRHGPAKAVQHGSNS